MKSIPQDISKCSMKKGCMVKLFREHWIPKETGFCAVEQPRGLSMQTSTVKLQKSSKWWSFPKDNLEDGFFLKRDLRGDPPSDSGQIGLFPGTREARMRLQVWTWEGVSCWWPLVRVPRQGWLPSIWVEAGAVYQNRACGFRARVLGEECATQMGFSFEHG